MDDMVSRQIVINAIDTIESEVADGEGFQYEKWREYFHDLPPVHPEIIRCKNCKYYDGRPCGIVDWYNTADDFCSKAERRTDA